MDTFFQSETNPSLKDKSQLVQIAQLNQLAWTVRNQDEKQSRILAETIYASLQESPVDDPIALAQLAKCLTTFAYLNHYYKANFELSLSQSLEAVALFEKINDSPSLPPGLNIAGLSYVRLGDPSEAMAYHLRALEICKKFNEAEVYNHIAISSVSYQT